MKILQFNLLAFGHFTGTLLDLHEGEEGLHVVYGPNEAGKSSALRALRQMLYGIPERSSDNFVHPYGKMRIGGALRHSDGTVIEFVRRKGRVNTLRTGDDREVLDETVLERFLGNVDAGLFATLFGIGHFDLVRGGEEIVQGGGNVGQALFAAGSGISDLRKVQMDLQTEAEALFAPAASKRRINEAIRELKKNRKEIREAQLPGREWQRHDEALRNAGIRRSAVAIELGEKQAEHNRLGRIKEALPLIGRRREFLQELKAYATAVFLPDDFGEQRRELFTELRIAENDRDQAGKSIDEIEKSMGTLEISDAMLESAGLIEQLYKELGSYQKAVKDRIQLQTKRDVLWGEAKEILSGLRDDFTLEGAEKLRLKKTETVRIRQLGTQYERLVTRLESSRDEIPGLSLKISGIDERLEALETPLMVDGLRDTVEQAVTYGALEDHYQSECSDLRSARSALEAALKRQSLWSGTLEALEMIPLVSIETIDVYDNRLEEARRVVSELKSRIDDLKDALLEIERQVRELQLEQEVPTEEDLEEARRHREEGWGGIRRALDEGSENHEEMKEFLESLQQTDNPVDAFEFSVHRADALADRLRREADRVATKAKLFADRETRKIRSGQLTRQLGETEKELEEIRTAWKKVWEPIGILPLSPREMRAWTRDQEVMIEKCSKIRERTAKADELNARILMHRKALDQCLCSISEPPAEEKENLSDLIRRSRRVIKRQESIKTMKEQLLTEKIRLEQELKGAGSRVETIEAELSRWQRKWEEAIRPLGLDADSVPEQANAVMDDLKSLFDKLKDADIFNKRVKGIDRDAEAFTAKVKHLADHVARDIKGLPVEQAATELNAVLTRSRTAGSEFQSLERQRSQEKERLRNAERSIAETRSKLGGMCEEAGCSRYEDLPEAENRSLKRRQAENGLRALDEQLLKLSVGATVEDFIRETQEVDPDGIDGQMSSLREEIERLEGEKSRIDQTIGEERSELNKMDGSARAADLAEKTQKILAQLETDVEHYARLKLASTVLAQAIERYRGRHQGPVLQRTNDLFAQLTLGSFEGIRAEFDDQGHPVLVGVRPGGREIVGTAGMSDGTTDQLYLALRLASLETYLENNESIPFILDDILIKFDNERAAASLRVLEELSRKTQVIFFTHHRHLVELAEGNIDPSILYTHSLGD